MDVVCIGNQTDFMNDPEKCPHGHLPCSITKQRHGGKARSHARMSTGSLQSHQTRAVRSNVACGAFLQAS